MERKIEEGPWLAGKTKRNFQVLRRVWPVGLSRKNTNLERFGKRCRGNNTCRCKNDTPSKWGLLQQKSTYSEDALIGVFRGGMIPPEHWSQERCTRPIKKGSRRNHK